LPQGSLCRLTFVPPIFFHRDVLALAETQLSLARATRRIGAILCWLSLHALAQGQPFQFSAAQIASNGSFSASLTAPLGRTYVVDASTNLANWSSGITNIVPISPISFVDSNASQLQRRFYRGRLYYTLIVTNRYPAWQTTNSGSGRQLAFPTGWQTAKGADGRTIAFPSGWNTAKGSDGRLIAFPPGFTNKVGADGRIVAFYQTGFTNLQGSDGRVLAFPASGWTNRLSADARRVAFPSTNFSTAVGADGRIAAFYSGGWTNSPGPDGRTVAYLSSEFSTAQGADGRKMAYPNSGWALRQGTDGRMTASPTNANLVINLDFQDQSLFALFGALKTVLSESDFNNYVIYTFFGTGDQQFND